uniref:inorganic diphosphatase n=1 Tax=Parachlorella kessleri TaxID=3074 RepID=A0A140JX01_PARKE|nr:vacuolar soluble pyrophosphatase [Parachlorella kessleri]
MAAVMRPPTMLAMRAKLVQAPKLIRAQPRLAVRASSVAASTKSRYVAETKGEPETLEFRVFLQEKGTTVSPWHDIPLHAGDGLLHFVCEIPKETSAKMEVATVSARDPIGGGQSAVFYVQEGPLRSLQLLMEEEGYLPLGAGQDEPKTPIKQDVKKGKLRFYPYNINWNYGLLPQTWEDPAHTNTDCNAAGDNDPVDVVEIGSTQLELGGVYKVKPLGVYAMIDDGELDWKVIAINAEDPKAASVNDVEDVEREFPGTLEKIKVWFRDYKIPDGKPANGYGYNDQCLNKEFTRKVIEETHGFYNKLRSGARENSEELSLY